jgi:hydrogenase-4 component B
MADFQLIVYSLWAVAVGIGLLLVVPARFKSLINLVFVFLVAIFTSLSAIEALKGNEISHLLNSQPLFGNITFQLDALSAWFILIVNFTSLMGAIYGMGYMKVYKDQTRNLTMHWINFLVFHSSMIWVCLAQNMLVFLVVWELMSLSSLLLVIFDYQNSHTLKAGLNYLIQMHIGVACLTVAFIWVYFVQGSLDFLALKSFFGHHTNIGLFLLLFAGFGIKAGFIPLHSWLPHAHPAAPSHVSGVMSGVIVKMGIYGIFRTITFLQTDYLLLGKIILILSIITGLYGIINASVHRDFKRMLAYCTIENIGIIGSGIGLGLIGMGNSNPILMALGFGGALLHTLNHSLFKSLLFFTAGSVYQQTHTRDMEKLGGLIKKMPKTAVLFLIGALAIGGLPPFNGFISEFILYSGFISGLSSGTVYTTMLMIFAIAALSLIGGISVFTFTKSFGVIFLGTPRTHLHSKPVEVPLLMRLPQYIIIGVMMLVALLPVIFVNQSVQVVSSAFTGFNLAIPAISHNLLDLMASIGKYSCFFFIFTLFLLLVRNRLAKRQPVSVSSTWGCGYIAPRPSIQYTGKSFSKTVGKLLNFLVFEQKKYIELDPGDVFPQPRKHSSHYTDFFELRLFDRVINGLLSAMNRFQFIQNGQLQRYILYGLFFIIVIFICSFFNLI